MSKTVLSALDGFTPLIDSVVDEMGLAAAAVFGKVWRYCQMETGACTASQDRLASELHISDRTLRTHLDALVERGYLALVRTAGGTNEYRDTGKAGLSIRIAATPEKISDLPRKNFPGGAEKISDLPRKNFPTKIDIKKEVKKEELEYEADPDEKFSSMRKLVETLTGRLCTPGDLPTLDKFAAEGVIEEDIRSALAWRVSQGLRPVANIRQLESGVLRNKASRVQAAAAATVKPAAAGQPAKKETALDRTKAALQKVMAEAMEEEQRNNGNQS